jgi:signal transduction histidine kinase
MCQNELDRIGGEKLSEDGAKSAERLRTLLDRAAAETRELTFELSSPLLHSLGLGPALGQLCEDVAEEHGLGIVFEDDGRDKALSEANQTVFFRSVRELLLNVTKHARASEARCSLSRHGDFVRAEVRDNGEGFDAIDAGRGFGPRGGFGLFNMREYVEHIGGRLAIHSAPGDGTCVVLEVPAGDVHA